jgi:hypothetical protein
VLFIARTKGKSLATGGWLPGSAKSPQSRSRSPRLVLTRTRPAGS